MKKVLLIVPHEDDELFVGGPLLIELARDNEYDVTVFIATNGDYYPFEHKDRINESIGVLKQIGISDDNIIFGGYGDCWKGKHIYNSDANEIKESFGGFSETYLDNAKNEWHFEKLNVHQKYTRNGYLHDIETVIEDKFPDIIICVDMDPHRDHRCVSLLTDEAMSHVLRKKLDYNPILLKKFAYESMLFGKSDFFEYPERRTVNNSDYMCNPFFKWQDRLSYMVPSDCNTIFLHTNYLFKLVKMYKTQNMWTYASSFINSDIVYWSRNTNNVVLNSNIKVTSGEKKYLNDFKLLDSSDIQNFNIDYSELCWRPDQEDKMREIEVELQSPANINMILLYFNCPDGLEGHYEISYELGNGQKKTLARTLNTKKDFFVDKIEISSAEVASFMISLKDVKGNLGIGEIEAISEKMEIPFKEYLYKDNVRPAKFCLGIKVALLLEKILFKIEKIVYYHTNVWIKKKREYDRRYS